MSKDKKPVIMDQEINDTMYNILAVVDAANGNEVEISELEISTIKNHLEILVIKTRIKQLENE